MKQIRLNAFVMNSVTHAHQGMWRHPRDQSMDYHNIDYWTRLATLLEEGKFDGFFIADGLGVSDVYGGDHRAAVRSGVATPSGDPAMLVSAMAAVTQHIGFGVTFSVTDETPYSFARRISTLDHLTKGRIGWNVVTGFLDSAARAKGEAKMMAHDDRYALAEEFMEIVYRLWEKSWDDDAVVRDFDRCMYADPDKVHAIHHEGRFFKMDAVHMSEPSPQRTPFLFQAGTSSKGVDFAARHAECVFVNGATPAVVGARVKKIREAAVAHGRQPDDIKLVMSTTVIVAPTDEEAEAKRREYCQYVDLEGGLVRLSGYIGMDLSKLDLDMPVKEIKTNAIQAVLENMIVGGANAMTVGEVANSLNRESAHPIIVGSPTTVADEMERWVREADVDGFNMVVAVKPETYVDFVRLVVPELQRRGVYKTAYAAGTFREKMSGKGAKTLPSHPSAKVSR